MVDDDLRFGPCQYGPASDNGFENLPKARLPMFSAPFLSALSSNPHSGHSKRSLLKRTHGDAERA